MKPIKSKSVQISDEEIIVRLNKNDERALNLLYDRYWEKLFISAYNLVKKREVCEDIIQEIFRSIWKKSGEFNVHTSLTIYNNMCYKFAVRFK